MFLNNLSGTNTKISLSPKPNSSKKKGFFQISDKQMQRLTMRQATGGNEPYDDMLGFELSQEDLMYIAPRPSSRGRRSDWRTSWPSHASPWGTTT